MQCHTSRAKFSLCNAVALAEPALGIFGGLIALAGIICSLIAYWQVFEGISLSLEESGNGALAQRMRLLRTFYLFSFAGLFVLSFVVAAVIVLGGGIKNPNIELWWLGYVTLPLGWLLCLFFVLSPLGEAYEALRGEPAAGSLGDERSGVPPSSKLLRQSYEGQEASYYAGEEGDGVNLSTQPQSLAV